MSNGRKYFNIYSSIVLLLLSLTINGCNELTKLTEQSVTGTTVNTEVKLFKTSEKGKYEMTNTPVSTRVKFLGASKNGKCDWNGLNNDYASIFLPRIYAIDKNTVFVFFAIEGYDSGYRTLILRSEDGGISWQEVMTPLLRSAIFHINFINNKVGWALAITGTEGPGDFTLYKSFDGGKSWGKVTIIQNRSMEGTIGMSFTNELKGEIILGRSAITPKSIVLRTSDGGLNWSEAESLSTTDYDALDDSLSKGLDGSEWKLNVSNNDHLIDISRRLPLNTNWSDVSILPEVYKIVNGCISEK
jgi:hypothetical protein